MATQQSLSISSHESSKIHRRSKSADDRPNSSSTAMNTDASINTLPHRPPSIISISSDDDVSTPMQKRPQNKARTNGDSSPRPSSAKASLTPQLTTPRPSINRLPASDPAVYKKSKPKASNDSPIAFTLKPKYVPPCGFKEYTRRGDMENHTRNCKCDLQSPRRSRKQNTYKDVEQQINAQQKSRVEGDQREVIDIVEDNDDEKKKNQEKEEERKKEEKANQELSAKANNNEEETSETSAIVTHSALITKICKKLTSKKEGFVYIVFAPEREGLIKLGHTNDVIRRRNDHKLKCGLRVRYLSISDPVKNCGHIESLIKLDLLHLRKPWKCTKCGTKHEEWFSIEPKKAITIANMWTTWMRDQKPYHEDRTLQPIWEYLVREGRRRTKELDEYNHGARWDHWAWVLSAPTEDDIQRFKGRKQALAHRISEKLDDSAIVTRALVDSRQNFTATNVQVQITNNYIH